MINRKDLSWIIHKIFLRFLFYFGGLRYSTPISPKVLNWIPVIGILVGLITTLCSAFVEVGSIMSKQYVKYLIISHLRLLGKIATFG